ncbi:NTP transferase domain-containing protein [Nocardioides sp. Arc9.136]|uniref:nucleotidyltransferase family protein n=1 Tax=Nocardioides sp. Arc9.136 TaxID=2996826 RepID=UPI0026651842|nr:NTP transferase domain-containing protein [Nocardioides sp. Arc9.136]WKN47945.1 NTP transferase domain-containing protein [Nocardioides sp. Arc9.136]
MVLHGIVLAAGAGSRMGTPKALVDDWLARAVHLLAEGGCDRVTAVLGARADDAVALLPPGTAYVVADDWSAGMSASLRTGLAAADPRADAALVTLVDLPDLTPEVVARVAARAGAAVLARAAYDGRPGHPVLLGREHWPGVLAATGGDSGAKGYLAGRDVVLVECGDLATGQDVDSR